MTTVALHKSVKELVDQVLAELMPNVMLVTTDLCAVVPMVTVEPLISDALRIVRIFVKCYIKILRKFSN